MPCSYDGISASVFQILCKARIVDARSIPAALWPDGLPVDQRSELLDEGRAMGDVDGRTYSYGQVSWTSLSKYTDLAIPDGANVRLLHDGLHQDQKDAIRENVIKARKDVDSAIKAIESEPSSPDQYKMRKHLHGLRESLNSGMIEIKVVDDSSDIKDGARNFARKGRGGLVGALYRKVTGTDGVQVNGKIKVTDACCDTGKLMKSIIPSNTGRSVNDAVIRYIVQHAAQQERVDSASRGPSETAGTGTHGDSPPPYSEQSPALAAVDPNRATAQEARARLVKQRPPRTVGRG